MEIIYYKDPIGNFGDDLNEWLWDSVAPFIKEIKIDYGLLGVGSIINSDIIKNNKVIVFGSGAGYGNLPSLENSKIMCIRGKLTAKLLNVDESMAISDSAILLNTISEFSPINDSDRDGIIFIPHHETMKIGNWQKICKQAGIELVDPTSDAKYVIGKIRKSKLVIAEAMHAAIIADTMRVKWIPVVANSNTNTFKWLDWLSMFEVNYNPIYIGLPDLYQERKNKLRIDYNIAMYKPNHLKMKTHELLSNKQKSKIKKILFKIKYSRINRKNVTTLEQSQHENKIVHLLKNASLSKSYLSSNDIFFKNLKSLQIKLEELRELKL